MKNLSFGTKMGQDSEELVSLLAERSARINSLEVEVQAGTSSTDFPSQIEHRGKFR